MLKVSDSILCSTSALLQKGSKKLILIAWVRWFKIVTTRELAPR